MASSPQGTQSSQEIKHNRKAQSAGAYTGIMAMYMFATVMAKLLGFGREIFIVDRFSYGAVSDGYILGYSIPDLVYRLLVGGAVTAAVTPILSSAIERDEEDKVWRPISTFYTVILISSFILLTLGEIFSGQIIGFLNPGKSAEVLDIASATSKVIFLQTFFFILIAIINSILSANKVFGLPVFGDSIYNFFCLLAIIFLGAPTKAGAVNVSWGVVFAALCYFLYMAYFAKPYVRNFKPNLDIKQPLFHRILRLAVPSLIADTVIQVNVIIQQSFADQFVGAITSLRNSQTLYNLPYQIIVSAIGPMLLPNISGFLARGANKEASRFFSTSLRSMLFMVFPFVILFGVCAEDTVRAVYQWNPATYTDANVTATASLLQMYSVNMLLQSFIYFINQAFYARQKSWIALVTSTLTIMLNPLFSWFYINVLDMGLQSLTMATVSYNLVILLVSYQLMKRHVPEIKIGKMGRFTVTGLVAGFLSFSVLLLMKSAMPLPEEKIMQLVQYVLFAVGGIGSYFLAALAMGMPEAQVVIRMFTSFRDRLKRKNA